MYNCALLKMNPGPGGDIYFFKILFVSFVFPIRALQSETIIIYYCVEYPLFNFSLYSHISDTCVYRTYTIKF